MSKSLLQVVRVAAPIRQQVIDLLRASIADGRYAQGERLIERELCDWLQISRPILREALRQLEAEGLVRNVPQRGIEVITLSAEDVRQIYQVRSSLEAAAAVEFLTHADDGLWAELKDARDRFEAAASEGVPTRIQAAKTRIFDILMDGCGNPIIAQILTGLHNRILILRGISLTEPGRIANTITEIRAVCDALEARDPERVRAAYVEHIDNSARNTIAAIERTEVKRKNLRR